MRVRDITNPTFEQVYKILYYCTDDHQVYVVDYDSGECTPISDVNIYNIKHLSVRELTIDKNLIVIVIEV